MHYPNENNCFISELGPAPGRLESTYFENNSQNLSSHLELLILENSGFFGCNLSKSTIFQNNKL